MSVKTYEYRTKLSYTNFISPAVGVFCIYAAITNTAGLGYRGKLIMSYPGSSYFLALVGVLLIIPIVFILVKSRSTNTIELRESEMFYTKGTLLKKEVTINYDNFKNVSFEDDEDDGSSISIDIGKVFDPQFYAKKFKSNAEYSEFCDEIKSIIEKRKY